jgi:hypothetical protein
MDGLMHHSADATDAHAADILSTVYGRLVRWHYTIAEAAAHLPPDVQAAMMREMMATLKEIADDPTFREAEARRLPPAPRPVDETRVARLRARAAESESARSAR